MNKYLKTLNNAAVFNNISDSQIEAMLSCLQAKEESFSKNQYILHDGQTVENIGVMLNGTALIIQEDFWGNRNIVTKVMPSEIFAESFACSSGVVMNVAVVVVEDCTVLWLNVRRILTICPSACSYHTKMIMNLLSGLAANNLRLNEKLTHTGKRSTREKVLSYLSAQAQKQNNCEFEIEFNRQQLADFLCVERSALSAELSKLRNDGMISFERSHFKLNLQTDEHHKQIP